MLGFSQNLHSFHETSKRLVNDSLGDEDSSKEAEMASVLGYHGNSIRVVLQGFEGDRVNGDDWVIFGEKGKERDFYFSDVLIHSRVVIVFIHVFETECAGGPDAVEVGK